MRPLSAEPSSNLAESPEISACSMRLIALTCIWGACLSGAVEHDSWSDAVVDSLGPPTQTPTVLPTTEQQRKNAELVEKVELEVQNALFVTGIFAAVILGCCLCTRCGYFCRCQIKSNRDGKVLWHQGFLDTIWSDLWARPQIRMGRRRTRRNHLTVRENTCCCSTDRYG